MYIFNQSKKEYLLSSEMRNGVCCEILPAVLVLDGAEMRGVIEESDADSQTCRVGGLTVLDRICSHGLAKGVFKATRTVTNRTANPIAFQSIFEVNTAFTPTHFVFPGFNYDTSQCSEGVSSGEILNTTKEGLASSILNTPTGLSREGQPWVFAYDREGIPSATISENEDYVFALFASDEDKISLESAASMIRNEDGTFRHRIFHPTCEKPYTYASKNAFEAPMERFFTLGGGESLTYSLYLFVGAPKYLHYGTAALLEACTKVFPFSRTPELSPKEVWDLGILYFRFLLKDADGVPMFSGHVSDRLFSKMHSGEITGEMLAKALEDPENLKLTCFSTSYEIGWAGQGAMVARLFATDGFRRGDEQDVKIAEECLDGYVSTQYPSGLLFPLYGQRNRPEGERRAPDACNMGWAMCELMRSYRLFRDHGIEKKNYREFAVRLAEFALQTYSPDYGFPKTWQIDGTPISKAGSIGGFMIMGLCEVHRETQDTRYLDTIIRAMDFYYRRDLDNFVCTAGAIDCACIDKETAYPFLEASLYLYEVTGQEIWLARAEKAAYYFYSWMFFYDCLYGENAEFSKYGYYTTGGTLISAEHSAIDPWGALVVNASLRLWRLTGNENFRVWAKMTWWNALLCITTEDTPLIHGNRRPIGSQNEAFFHCRWTKYRPTCEERGHFNDNLQTWMGAFRLHTLTATDPEHLTLLWKGEENQ